MNKVCFLFLFFYLYNQIFAQQNPHENNIKLGCLTCHNVSNWNDISQNNFEHNITGFPLLGAHQSLNCVSCHISLKFSEVNSNCSGCHTDVHMSELGQVCNNCHSEQRWDDRTTFTLFHSQTDFPLTGVHTNLDCESCHYREQHRQYANTPVECAGCHLDLFMSSSNPNHLKAWFDLNCQKCHLASFRGWNISIFIHSDIFPLSGGHANISCTECHGQEYNILKVECMDCHQTAFESSFNPNHNAFGFSRDCGQCHTGIRWERTLFNHFNVSGFALEGRHKNAFCIDCHHNNQLSGWPVECSGCHLAEYNLSINPNHQDASFPITCDNCHYTFNWDKVKWNHDAEYFPIYSGKHQNEWDNCTDCHLVSENYAQFECIYCHEHRQSKMDNEHHNKRNYVYDSQACLNCHPRGRE
jgi:hypothetical protein